MDGGLWSFKVKKEDTVSLLKQLNISLGDGDLLQYKGQN